MSLPKTSRMKAAALPVASLLALTVCASAHAEPAAVSVEVLDARGSPLEQVPLDSARAGVIRAYLAAERGATYRIQVRNESGQRVGVVIAVDGRNIISGARSELAHGEPMYVLEPYGSQSYSGWRTSLASVQQFYFTDFEHSYANAFGDSSARGVIAVAVYREVPHVSEASDELARAPAAAARADAAGTTAGSAKATAPQPGTGYGEHRAEAAVRVAFDAEPREQARVLIKYEWRETLCHRRLLECAQPLANRLWDEDGRDSFAPPPPRR
jgi:hypothetical protein